MSTSGTGSIKWRWCLLAATATMLLSIMPQLHFSLVRGSQWEGAYVLLQGDELLYSAYINALIDGRSRRNDPFAGEDHHPLSPMKESLFSVQYIPAFLTSFPARLFGCSASTAFIVLAPTAGLLASFSIFWLLSSMTGDHRFAAVGVLVVLCLGTLAGGHGVFGLLLKEYEQFFGLLFVRRYEPCVPFPLFFVFCALIWKAFSTPSTRAATARAVVAGLVLAVLIFSYFYLWTAAIAWFVCITVFWLVAHKSERRRIARVCLMVGAPTLSALLFYSFLLSRLPPAVGESQVLQLTHRPDLIRVPEILGTLILILLFIGIRLNRFVWRQPSVIFAASFAILPFLVFNQQILSGRSLQPYHYETFIANYAVLISLVVTGKLLQRSFRLRTLLIIASSCFLWGAVEVNVTFLARYNLDLRHDEMVPVFLRLNQLAQYDGTWEGLGNTGRTPALVFSPETGVSRMLPTWAPQGTLLGMGSMIFQALPRKERMEALYAHLYYCGKTTTDVRQILNGKGTDPYLISYSRTTLFGPERVLSFLGQDVQPINQEEIEREVQAYGTFVDSFSLSDLSSRQITYVITLAQNESDLSRIDLWYERDGSERVGNYSLYRVTPRK